MWHLDIGKLVMSFAARRPQGGNFYVAANFQGSTDSQASAASRQEMGFESLIRFSYDLPRRGGEGKCPVDCFPNRSGWAQ
jgi:hypothetical protein